MYLPIEDVFDGLANVNSNAANVLEVREGQSLAAILASKHLDEVALLLLVVTTGEVADNTANHGGDERANGGNGLEADGTGLILGLGTAEELLELTRLLLLAVVGEVADDTTDEGSDEGTDRGDGLQANGTALVNGSRGRASRGSVAASERHGLGSRDGGGESRAGSGNESESDNGGGTHLEFRKSWSDEKV